MMNAIKKTSVSRPNQFSKRLAVLLRTQLEVGGVRLSNQHTTGTWETLRQCFIFKNESLHLKLDKSENLIQDLRVRRDLDILFTPASSLRTSGSFLLHSLKRKWRDLKFHLKCQRWPSCNCTYWLQLAGERDFEMNVLYGAKWRQ